MPSAFDGRIALVTGGSRGIGRATALRLAQEGADVAISYASRTHDAEEVVREITALGRRATAERCDVSQPEQVQRLVDRVRRDLGSIDLLAHCGAISNICDHTELTWDRWRDVLVQREPEFDRW